MKDILLDEDFNLQIKDGDFVCGDSTQQHVQCLLKANKGDFKESPQTGFGIDNYLKKSTKDFIDFERDLKVELVADGFEEPEIKVEISPDDTIELNINV